VQHLEARLGGAGAPAARRPDALGDQREGRFRLSASAGRAGLDPPEVGEISTPTTSVAAKASR
jgi:hypothetical protein